MRAFKRIFFRVMELLPTGWSWRDAAQPSPLLPSGRHSVGRMPGQFESIREDYEWLAKTYAKALIATAAEVGLALCDLCNGEIPDSVRRGWRSSGRVRSNFARSSS